MKRDLEAEVKDGGREQEKNKWRKRKMDGEGKGADRDRVMEKSERASTEKMKVD